MHSDWSNYYPVGPEYQRYLQAVADWHAAGMCTEEEAAAARAAIA